MLEERRLLLQWALAEIARLRSDYASLLTENGILWQRSEELAREVDVLRDQIARTRRIVPASLRKLGAKITR